MQPTTYTITSSRTFNYPVSKVYEAWTNPELLAKWWGPNGFKNTFHEHDLRPGGRWIFTMHGPEKGNYENAATFEEVKPNEFLSWSRQSQPLFNVNVHFEAVAENHTKVVFKMIFDNEKLYNTINGFAL